MTDLQQRNPKLVKRFKGVSYRLVYWKLRDEQLPEPIIAQTIESLRAARAAEKAFKLRTRQANRAWDEVIASLQHERRIVRTMCRYKTVTPAPERDEFVQAYNALLIKTYEKLIAKRRLLGQMPEHTHWTDFVPEKIKAEFRAAAEAMPTRHRAKMKMPFERIDSFDIHDKRKARLLRSIASELKTAEAVGQHEKVARLREAQRILKEMQPPAHVPNTWHGLLKD